MSPRNGERRGGSREEEEEEEEVERNVESPRVNFANTEYIDMELLMLSFCCCSRHVYRLYCNNVDCFIEISKTVLNSYEIYK